MPELIATEKVPAFTFLSDGMSGAVAFAAYHESTRDIFPCALYPDQSADDFKVEMTGWHLGLFLLATIRATPLMFDRSAQVVAESGLDGVTFQLYTEGGFAGLAGEARVEVRAGDICLFDLRQTVVTQASAFHTLSMLVPRKFFDDAFGDVAPLHGMVLPAASPMTELLAAHLTCLVERVPRLKPRQGLAAAQGTLALIMAVIRGMEWPGRHRAARIIASPFRAIADYIEANLRDPELAPEVISARFGMSRASLYRLFAQVGGVSGYIRRHRLSAAAVALVSPECAAERVGQIALRFGFGSEASFCRSFRAEFGVSPGEARQRADGEWAVPMPRMQAAIPGRDFRGWSKTIR